MKRDRGEGDADPARDAFLATLGDRVRLLRARRGLTRRGLSQAAGVSERHLANLEQGVGNASILVLREVAQALSCSLAELLGDETASSPEWLLLRDLLGGRSAAELQHARQVLAPLFGAAPQAQQARLRRIALIGLRGGGKTTLGRMLADHLEVSFVEVNHEIERVSGGTVAEIYNLYGPGAYHRYERRVVEEILDQYQDAVIGTPGSIVSEPPTFGLLLAHCYTVWIQASPEEHMQRVIDEGDLRPMRGNVDHAEAMDDLKRILAGRAAFYGKADLHIDTSGLNVTEAFARLDAGVRAARSTLVT
ncbi:MAG TPA: helix-turn-helix transcriptional regulator [Nevskiaceae bacterium]|nr:helix-turn-helix transcriptional regulator [Nevskiaceae bacterium]